MRLIIAGTRDMPCTIGTVRRMGEVVHEFADGSPVTAVLCGECRGVDQVGKAWARLAGIPVESFPADWERHGRAAGPKRNEEMAKSADALIVIRYPRSRGSRSMLELAKRHGLAIKDIVIGEGES